MQQTDTVGVQDFLNIRRFSNFQKLVFALCFLTAFFDGMDTAAVGYIAPALSNEWGVQKAALAPVLSAALFGLAAGAAASGPLADKIGRRIVLTASVLLFAAFCAASALAENLTQLAVLRFITGLGLGAAMPNAVALLAEFCPERKRAFTVNTMYCGFPLGAAAGGFFASWLIPGYGWRMLLFWCGLMPLALGVFMMVLLPESPAYLAAKGRPQAQIRKILSRIDSAAATTAAVFTTEPPPTRAEAPTAAILGAKLRAGTLLLWTSYFMGLIVFYSVINWMPTLFKETGLGAQAGAQIAGLFALGGLGAAANGYLMDRFDGNRLIALMSLLTALSVASVGFALKGGLWLLVGTVLFAGLAHNTAQASLPALAAQFYPTACRTTGIAWMLGIGRMGAVAGTFLTGLLLVQNVELSAVFAVLAVPSVVMAACLWLKYRLYRNQA
ncbi:MFS transporter [Neisseria chenwenguii]|uniref:Aromatic acid/H+ symport family MFS transporter n=1 Tax=Neisseria chenwenguii TaxID=1853278 RepID=A0A220S5J4_9NEIS|nr:MFS transporter [Neisseria chenwenguii]ASK28558.1 aromatic acid/H+ symport family MFS transporter [Neisseria chenwenguii]ROV57426.1 MFS transporter [Neisseria chenwenguii]